MPAVRASSQARTQGAFGLVSPDATEDAAWRRVFATQAPPSVARGVTYPIPSIFLMAPRLALVTSTSLRKPRLRFDDFFSRLWLRIAGRRRILPLPVTLNFFFTDLRVFTFGISCHSCVLRRAEQHHHVASVLEGLRLDLPDLLDVVGEPEEQVAAPLRVGLRPAPENDRDLHLRALVEESLDVSLLGVVVVDADLRPELDLLHLDLALVLAGLLRLLLLLVLVLPVVHDLGDGRVGLGCDLDEVEVLAVGVVARLVRGLDSELAPV